MQLLAKFEDPTTDANCEPEGYPGACFVAHLMLAVMYCFLEADARARVHIAHACEIARALSGYGHTVRVPQLMKVLRIFSEVDDMTTVVHMPLVGDSLVVPDINLSKAMPSSAVIGDRVDLFCDLEMAYFRLRLRPRRILAALSGLSEACELPKVGRAAQEIIDQCMYAQIHTVTTLDRVGDYFTLAENLVTQGNPALAIVALKKANAIFSVYSKSSGLEETTDDFCDLQLRLQSLLERLAARAS